MLRSEEQEGEPLALFLSEDAFEQTPNEASFLSRQDEQLNLLFTVKRVIVVYFKLVGDLSHLVSLVNDVFLWLNKDSLGDHEPKDPKKPARRVFGSLGKETAVFIMSVLEKKLAHVP